MRSLALALALLLSCAHTPQEAPPVKPPTPLRWQGELVRGVVKACEGADACEYYWCPQHPCPEVLDMGTDGGVK